MSPAEKPIRQSSRSSNAQGTEGRLRILFQGSHVATQQRSDPPYLLEKARSIARALGRSIIESDFDLVLTGACNLDREIGAEAIAACQDKGLEPRDRIRTYLIVKKPGSEPRGYGSLVESTLRYWQQLRTQLVREVDAVVTISGGKGVADAIDKAELLGVLAFPIATAGGASHSEWQRLRDAGYGNHEPGDIEFLADIGLQPDDLATRICDECRSHARGSSESPQKPPGSSDEERSMPMELKELARRFQPNMGPRKFKDIARERYGLEQMSRKRWTVRLDLMDPATRVRFER